MKHLARIQSEFVHIAGKHLDWWEAMSNQEQDEYIKRHPKTKMRPTPQRMGDLPPEGKTEPELVRDTQQTMDQKRQHVHSMLRKLKRHPGDAHAKLVPQSGIRNGEHRISVEPGTSPDAIIQKRDGRFYEGETEVRPDEAASILRHQLGSHEWEPKRPKWQEKAIEDAGQDETEFEGEHPTVELNPPEPPVLESAPPAPAPETPPLNTEKIVNDIVKQSPLRPAPKPKPFRTTDRGGEDDDDYRYHRKQWRDGWYGNRPWRP